MSRTFVVVLIFQLVSSTVMAQFFPENHITCGIPEAHKVLASSDYPNHTVVVAVIDNGVNLLHEDLVDGFWINRNEIKNNGIDDDQNGFVDDYYGWNFDNNTGDVSINGIGNWHGTPVNGIIGANSFNNIGIKGIAPNVKLMNIVKGNSVESYIESLEYIYRMRKRYNDTNGEEGAFVVSINCSWGVSDLWAVDYPDWCAMYDKLGSVGVLSVSSVPNNYIDVDLYGDMPTTCPSDYLITVTDTYLHNGFNTDTGYGSTSVDLVAPGTNTYTTLNNGTYGYFGGTSAAAPYVAGTVALLYALPIPEFRLEFKDNPAEASSLLKRAILEGVTKDIVFENTTVSGGVLNAFNTSQLLAEYYDYDMGDNKFEALEIVSVHPNPASSLVHVLVETDSEKTIGISLFDINGQITATYSSINTTERIQSIPLDITDLANGIYVLLVSSKNQIRRSKLIVQHN